MRCDPLSEQRATGTRHRWQCHSSRYSRGSDDSRDSLAYKLRKILTLKARETLCTDPNIVDDRFLPLDDVL